jgi:thiamine biosynthesis lipoprotein
MTDVEQIERFACFGASCSVLVAGPGSGRSARQATLDARHSLEAWHRRFSRFAASSELSQLNADPRRDVPASGLMLRLAAAVRTAGELSGGLVDATLVDEIEIAGYTTGLDESLALTTALALAPARRPGVPAALAEWQDVDVSHGERRRWRVGDDDGHIEGFVSRPPGLKIDGGGLAKGLFADVLAERLAAHRSFAVECAGDIAIGGLGDMGRPVHVQSPFDASILHTFEIVDGCVATSGIGRRSWIDRHGRPAHHLLDPSTGEPAFTGIVQATALAPSALEAEVRAKAALLAGPRSAHLHLSHGGLLVFDDGSHQLLRAPLVVTLGQLSAFARGRGAAGAIADVRPGTARPRSAAAELRRFV